MAIQSKKAFDFTIYELLRIVARDWLNWARDTIKDRSYPRRFHKRYSPSDIFSFSAFFLSYVLTLIPQFV